MRLAIVVPGGVDRSAEVRVIPAFLSLIERLARRHDVQVFALEQEPRPASWLLRGATVHNAGGRFPVWRSVGRLVDEHRRQPFDLLQSLFAGNAGLVACIAGARLGLPYAVHVGGGEIVNLPQIGYGGQRHWRGRCREALVLGRAASVSAASRPMIDLLRGLGVDALRIPLGADLASWPPVAPRPRDPGSSARLVHVASLNRVKDAPTVLRSLALLASAGVKLELDVVGEDTLRGEVQRLAEKLQLSGCVRFHGFLTQPRVREILAHAHVCVMSSHHEAGPLVVLEAATLGVPTVGTRVGHIAEWDGTAALAVPVGDAPALAQALRTLIEDEARRLALARNAQQRALSEDADFTAAAFEGNYQRLLAGRRGRS